MAIVLLVAITATILYFLPGWLIGAWMCVLMGILAGKVFTLQAAQRGRFYLVAFFYLAAMMLLWVVPRLVLREPSIPQPIEVFSSLLLPLSLVALAFLPFDPKDDDSRQVFDFFYAVLVFQLVVAGSNCASSWVWFLTRTKKMVGGDSVQTSCGQGDTNPGRPG